MLRYDIVDVFCEQPFAGNQLAVVHGAQDLTADQCLTLAREFNISETTFPEPRTESSYFTRIFTPGGEIPFAGHPTLGTAWVLREQGHLTVPRVTQQCGAGAVGVAFGDDLVELSAQPRDRLGPVPRELAVRLLEEVELGADDLLDIPVLIAGTGLNFVHLPVRADAVARSGPALRPFRRFDADLAALGTAADPIEGLNVFAYSGGEGTLEVHARVFVPGLSIPEDPATGSAAAGLGMALLENGLIADGGRYRITQGVEMGRPSVLYGRAADGLLHVAGAVQPIASGTIRTP
jgi:trans-2,3-dihydro-3-hydroxyanthranilate isomerase